MTLGEETRVNWYLLCTSVIINKSSVPDSVRSVWIGKSFKQQNRNQKIFYYFLVIQSIQIFAQKIEVGKLALSEKAMATVGRPENFNLNRVF